MKVQFNILADFPYNVSNYIPMQYNLAFALIFIKVSMMCNEFNIKMFNPPLKQGCVY